MINCKYHEMYSNLINFNINVHQISGRYSFRVQVPVPLVHSDIAWLVPEVSWLASLHHDDSEDEVNRLIGTRL